tara:strand:+ start:174 stop:557 length:384 start_codon:yes stop_codon:yes gene_type:complete
MYYLKYQYKTIYIEISKKWNIPFDIIINIYDDVIKHYMVENINIKSFYKNIMLIDVFNIKKGKMEYETYDDLRLLQKDIFNYRIPITRGLEWVIKSYCLNINNLNRRNFNNCMLMIKILGDKKNNHN